MIDPCVESRSHSVIACAGPEASRQSSIARDTRCPFDRSDIARVVSDPRSERLSFFPSPLLDRLLASRAPCVLELLDASATGLPFKSGDATEQAAA